MSNPYEAPKSATMEMPEDNLPSRLASRWLRLWGALLDALFIGIPVMGLAYALGVYDNMSNQGTMPFSDHVQALILGIGGFLIINGKFIREGKPLES